MGTFLVALKTVLPLFLVIFAGTLFTRSKAFSKVWIEVLNKYALYIGFPALVIASLMHLKPGQESFATLIFHTSVYTISCILLAFPIAKVFRFSRNMLRTLFLILPFGNFAYLGIPVIQNALGDEMLPTAAILSAVYLFWLLTLGIVLIEAFGDDKIHPKKMLLSLLQNPLLLSVFIGLAIFLFKIELPLFAEKTIHLFSSSVTAIILFALGMFLGTQEIGKLKEWKLVIVFVVSTMLLLPACFYAYLQLISFNEMFTKASILDAAMPLGLTPYLLAVEYNLESKLAARIVVFGTFLSVFIIPLWMVWLG